MKALYPILILALLLLVGCAENALRVTGYGATGIPGVSVKAGGCQVSKRGSDIPGVLIYEGDNCRYHSELGVLPVELPEPEGQ